MSITPLGNDTGSRTNGATCGFKHVPYRRMEHQEVEILEIYLSLFKVK